MIKKMAYFRSALAVTTLAAIILPLFVLANAHPFYAETGPSTTPTEGTVPNYGITSGSGGTGGGSTGGYSARYPLSYFGDVTPPATSVPNVVVSTCRDIIAAGTYIVDRDLLSERGSCITIHDTANVQFYCAGHSIRGERGFHIKNVNGFSLKFCNLSSADLVPLVVETGKNGEVTNNTIAESVVRVSLSEAIRFADNTFTSSYEQNYSNRMTVENNSFSAPAKASGVAEFRPFVMAFSYGTNNKAVRNTIDGRVTSFMTRGNGAADGIKISDESGDSISQNTIRNIGNCGIRTIGFIYNTSFVKNYIKNTGFCGIGADVYMSWDGNEVADNTIDEAPQMFSFVRVFGLRPAGFDPLKKLAADPRVYFKDNVFSNNTYVNVSPQGRVVPTQSAAIAVNHISQGTGGIPGERPFAESTLFISNNVVKGNNFSRTRHAPLLYPSGIVTDGGGNICGPAPEGYPLDCGPKGIATRPAAALSKAPAKPVEPESFIVITSPNGGAYLVSENLTIAWESKSVSFVTIELVDELGRRVRTAAPKAQNQNTFVWVIPENLSGTYRIKIYDTDRAEVTALSAPFMVEKRSGQAAAAFPLVAVFLKYIWYFLLFILGVVVGILAMKVVEKEKQKKEK